MGFVQIYNAMDSLKGEEEDAFKSSFKFYKTRKITPDLTNVIDFEDPKQLKNLGVQHYHVQQDVSNSEELGLKSVQEWEIYIYPKCPGLIFIKNPFTKCGQKYWVKQCLAEFPRSPNKTNLDIHYQFPSNESIWTLSLSSSSRYHKCIENLRWVTLGYHHDWNTKVYNTDNYTPMAENLKTLTEFIAKVLGFHKFSAEAAIVNFYHMDSTLAGHTDHSEFDLNAPLLSISFGQSAVFLLGGHTRSIKPVPMFLRSGDVVIMSGYSRLSYHAVPRILFANKRPWKENDDSSVNEQDKNGACEDWELFENYLRTARINLNVRQVFHQK